MYNVIILVMLLIGFCYAMAAAYWLLDKLLTFHEQGLERVKRYEERIAK